MNCNSPRRSSTKKSSGRRAPAVGNNGLHPSLRLLLEKAIADQNRSDDRPVIRIIRAGDDAADPGQARLRKGKPQG